MQTTLPPYAKNMREGWSNVTAKEGIAGLYKGLVPLWGRQIPYTMCKFATFEEAVKMIYRATGKPKESFSTATQTAISFTGGYIAGIACAVISHPADLMVSKLNSDRKGMAPPSLYPAGQGELNRAGVSGGRQRSSGPLQFTLTLRGKAFTDLCLAGEGAGVAMGRIYKNIGFSGLWNGLPVRIVMIGTLTGFQWLVYDSFKVYLGLPTTGGH